MAKGGEGFGTSNSKKSPTEHVRLTVFLASEKVFPKGRSYVHAGS
jgi:hypothetical protein